MDISKIFKMSLVSLAVIILNVFIFSPGLLGLSMISGNALQAAMGATILLVSAISLIYAGYTWIWKDPLPISISQVKTHDDYITAFTRLKQVKSLENDMQLALEQLGRFNKKKDALFRVLSERFEPEELSYKKFSSVLLEVEKLFFLNLRSLLNRLSAFDESEYAQTTGTLASRLSKELLEEKTKLYRDYLSFAKQSLQTNEEMFLKMDKLLLEISRLDSFEAEDIENMAGMQEIDALIKQTKLYKS